MVDTNMPPSTIVFRVCLVHPEDGLTGVLVIEGDKPAMRVAGTPEEVEKVRADLESQRAAGLLSSRNASDRYAARISTTATA